MPRKLRPDRGALIRSDPATPLAARIGTKQTRVSTNKVASAVRSPGAFFGGVFVLYSVDVWR